MKKIFFLSLLVSGCLAVSCEQGEELVLQKADSAVKATDVMKSMPVSGSYAPKKRSFILDIEGGDHAVGIINRLKSPKEVIIVTRDMCPYYYESYVPEMEIDGYEPEGNDIEILPVNSSMPYIEGFRDDYGNHCHPESYSYGALFGESLYITAVFAPEVVTWRPLPEGVNDSPAGDAKLPPVVDVSIVMERPGNAFYIRATYVNRFGDVEQTDVGMFTNLRYVNAESPLALSVTNTTSFLGQLTINTDNGKKVIRLKGGENETLSYDLKNTNDGIFNIRIE